MIRCRHAQHLPILRAGEVGFVVSLRFVDARAPLPDLSRAAVHAARPACESARSKCVEA
jgi:hypothetical protein